MVALYSNIYPQSQGESFSFKRKENKFSFLRQFFFFNAARVRQKPIIERELLWFKILIKLLNL
jgi:hypothetical protein